MLAICPCWLRAALSSAHLYGQDPYACSRKHWGLGTHASRSRSLRPRGNAPLLRDSSSVVAPSLCDSSSFARAQERMVLQSREFWDYATPKFHKRFPFTKEAGGAPRSSDSLNDLLCPATPTRMRLQLL
eukprot:4863554-Pleurochrysis_carterae.AAC.2